MQIYRKRQIDTDGERKLMRDIVTETVRDSEKDTA